MSGIGAFARFRAGEQRAAHRAVADYGPAAYAAAFGVLREAASAEAVAAAVLAEGLGGAGIPTGDELAERAWVAATARARALASASPPRRRRFGRRSHASRTSASAREAVMSGTVDAAVAHRAFEALPLATRNALGFAYGSGLPPGEVGRRLGFSADEARDVLREGLLEIEHRVAEGAT